MTTHAVWLNSPQRLLQQCADFLVAILAFLVQFYKKIGRGLECLIDCARVFAVCSELLKPPDEAVKEGECLAVYIIKAYTSILLCHKYFL